MTTRPAARGPRFRSGARLAVVLFARIILGTAVVSSLWTVVPLAFGWSSAVVVSGSMMPRIHPGDVVVAQPITAAKVRPGQPVLVENPAKPGHLLLHRVVRRNANGTLVTKGDANEIEDSAPVPQSAVRALPRLLVRHIGLPMLWASTGAYRELLITAAVFAILVATAVQAESPRSGRGSGGSRSAGKRWPGAPRPQPRRRRERFRRSRGPAPVPGPVVGAVGAGVAVAVALTTGTVQSNYVSVKSTASSSWQSGYVTFGANSPAGAMVTIPSTTVAGGFGTQCVKVTYTGSLAAQVRLYVSSVSGGGLEPYLGVQVRSGSGNAATCSDFAVTGTDYNTTGLTDTSKTLGALRTASYDYATGIGSWNATNGNTRTYQLSWLMLPDNNAVNRNVNFTVTWEARS